MKIIEPEIAVMDPDLDGVEARTGVVLPDDLRAFFLRNNGGIPVPDTYLCGGVLYTVSHFIPIKDNEHGLEQAFRFLWNDERSPENVIPIAMALGGDVFLYSIDEATFGNILIARSDYVDDERGFIVNLAPSLGLFLDGLVPHPFADSGQGAG